MKERNDNKQKGKLTMQITRIKRDINGNPRYVIHFLELLSEQEQRDLDKTYRGTGIGASIDAMEKLAVKRAKTIGGKKYRGMDFGGGIVFSSYSIQQLQKDIEGLRG